MNIIIKTTDGKEYNFNALYITIKLEEKRDFIIRGEKVVNVIKDSQGVMKITPKTSNSVDIE